MQNEQNDTDYTKTNLLRICLSFTYATVNYLLNDNQIINILFWSHFTFSIIWFVIIKANIFIEKNHNWSGFIPSTMDIMGNCFLIVTTGNIHSSFIVVFFIITSLSSLNTNKYFGIFAAIASFISFIIIGLLVYWQIIPNMNIFSDTNASVNLSNLSINSGYMALGLFSVNQIISKTFIDFEKEKAYSDALLKNILPLEVIPELKYEGNVKPKSFESVTVMFTDFVGFTKIADSLSAYELVSELDKCFSHFDAITKQFKLEKIKTIGDSYMTCGGIPQPNSTHPVDSILAAMEIQSFMEERKKTNVLQGTPFQELRVGIHCGPLVAGVIGEMKFTYDVFGDTVNTASRMESSGEAAKINISKPTYELIKDFFDCEYRGEISAKNKGFIDMYFVKGIREELSVHGEKKSPNQAFQEKYKELEKKKILKY